MGEKYWGKGFEKEEDNEMIDMEFREKGIGRMNV